MLRVVLALFVAVTIATAQDAKEWSRVNLQGCGFPNAAAAAKDYDPFKIVGGVEAQPNYWIWQASMMNGGSHSCGGSIINPRWILTAAHCTQTTASRLTIRVGSHSRTSGGQVFQVERIINHPAYGSGASYANDVALLKLSTPITYTKEIGPICLVNGTVTTEKIHERASIVTGWGTLSSGGIGLPTNLQQVTVKVDTDDRCRGAYGTSFQAASMICASDSGKDSCQGDSGGPLFIELNGQHGQIGIVSWGRGCALAAYPGVYSKVSALLPWIAETVANN